MKVFLFFITCRRTNDANNATRYVKLGKERWESPKRHHYIMSPRVTTVTKAINIMINEQKQDFPRIHSHRNLNSFLLSTDSTNLWGSIPWSWHKPASSLHLPPHAPASSGATRHYIHNYQLLDCTHLHVHLQFHGNVRCVVGNEYPYFGELASWSVHKLILCIKFVLRQIKFC